MSWLSGNWFWILVAIAFVALHLFGHGGHGGHSGHRGSRDDRERGDRSERGAGDVRTGEAGHAH